MLDMVVKGVLLLNAIWFGMAFEAFYRRRKIFGKVSVPDRAQRDNAAYESLVEAFRFLGGFNLALSILNILLLFNLGGFNADTQWAVLLIFNALAHGSQFWGNVPTALQNRRGTGHWTVFKGVMLRIFVVDFTLMVFNSGLAVILLF